MENATPNRIIYVFGVMVEMYLPDFWKFADEVIAMLGHCGYYAILPFVHAQFSFFCSDFRHIGVFGLRAAQFEEVFQHTRRAVRVDV